ncbi:hypothetical protein FH972_024339 [Carpinus fangiana]|uniref:DUF1275 domain protein n=1 Tax=Carpinus fangiana TaxID=176857 RepID=A0A5N6KY34_9ROSI|nr:hypothetical protein FH972_024339 [Carpinus fangiana]
MSSASAIMAPDISRPLSPRGESSATSGNLAGSSAAEQATKSFQAVSERYDPPHLHHQSSPELGSTNRGAMGILARKRLLGAVKTNHGDLCLLAYCFVTGMLDCASFNNWGVFVAMQTGNTVILCLATTGLPASQPWSYATTLVSLVSFFIGAILTTHVSRWAGASLRPTIFVNFLLQALMIALSAAIVTAGLIPYSNNEHHPSVEADRRIIGGLPPLAFQSGMQIASSRLLGFGTEIPVNVLTSTYAALAADPKLLARDNRPRDRRVAAVVLLASGALCSAWIMENGPGIVLVLWLGAGIKLAVAIIAGLWMQPVKEDAQDLITA